MSEEASDDSGFCLSQGTSGGSLLAQEELGKNNMWNDLDRQVGSFSQWGDRVELEDGEIFPKVPMFEEGSANQWALTEWDQAMIVSSDVVSDEVYYEDPLCILLPPPSSRWVFKQVQIIRKKMGISFDGIEEKVEDLFREIERRRESRMIKNINKNLARCTLRKGCREIKIFGFVYQL